MKRNKVQFLSNGRDSKSMIKWSMFKGPQCESVALCYDKIYLKIYEWERSRKRRTREERERERKK